MSVQMKLGRWRARDGTVHVIDQYDGTFWEESSNGHWWNGDGCFHARDWDDGEDLDLIEYLGPLSPTPASAEAGPAGSSTVSTEDRQEQLRRMRQRFVDIQREVRIYSDLLPALERAMYDVEELIKRLEKEVEG